jgi:acetylglutamate kinase
MSVAPDSYASLHAAARYVQAFRDRTFVFKLGGEVLEDVAMRRAVCEQLNVLWSFSIRLVIVHGGGAHVDALCDTLGLSVKKVGGRRVTTPAVMDAVKMGLAGTVHMDLLAALGATGLPVVGVSGVDAGLVWAKRRPPAEILNDAGENECVDYGCVGDVDKVDPTLLNHLLEGGYVPLVAPLSADDQGNLLNINADTVAAELAVALGAEKLFFLLKVPGLLEDVMEPTSLIPYATAAEVKSLEEEGKVTAGMHPKLAAVRRALAGGVTSAHLISGLAADAVLAEVFTNQGSGTMIVTQDGVAAERAA